MDKPAIILVDMLNDFVTGKLEFVRAKAIIPNFQRFVIAAVRAPTYHAFIRGRHLGASS